METITVASTTTRLCKLCATIKPIKEFRLVKRWRLRVCDSCRRGQMSNYHHKHWEEYYRKHQETRIKRSRNYYTLQRAANLELYGEPRSPEQTRYSREHTIARRLVNKALCGYAKPEREQAQSRRLFASMRAKALTYYGNKCVCCGESRYDMLTFDHIKGDGSTGVRGVRLVYAVIREFEESGYPNNKYRILCWNCNTSRGFYKYCPHETQEEWYTNQGRLLKSEMIIAYGGKCSLCGETRPEFMTIDHINGGGAQHRKSRVVNGGMYRWLKKQGWPKSEYRLLCANCNCSAKRNKWSKVGR